MISQDLQRRILAAYLNGEGSQHALASRFAVGHATVERILHRYRTIGTTSFKPYHHGRRPIVDEAEYPLVVRCLEENVDATQQQIADYCREQVGLEVSRRTISRVLKRMHYTRKKRP